MGTPNLVIVYYKGKYRIVQYAQFSGDPDTQGATVLAFIRVPENIAKLRVALDEEQVYTLTKDERNELREEEREANEYPSERARRGGNDWLLNEHSAIYPTLSYDVGGKILRLVAEAKEPVPTFRDMESIMCVDWTYVVDLDINTFEVFSGCDESLKLESDRFKELIKPGSKDYRPPLCGLWALDSLPSEADFIEHFREPDEGEDDTSA